MKGPVTIVRSHKNRKKCSFNGLLLKFHKVLMSTVFLFWFQILYFLPCVSLHRLPSDAYYRRIWTANVKLTRAKWSGPSEFVDLISKSIILRFLMATTYSIIFISQPCGCLLVCSNSMEECAAFHGTAGMAGLVVSVRLHAQVYVMNSATSRLAKLLTILF